jgi:hypothetical protein
MATAEGIRRGGFEGGGTWAGGGIIGLARGIRPVGGGIWPTSDGWTHRSRLWHALGSCDARQRFFAVRQWPMARDKVLLHLLLFPHHK